jgi:hypothetical protein
LLASLLPNQKPEKNEKKKFKQKTQQTATRCRTPVAYSKKPISQTNLLLLLRLLNTSRAIPRSQAGNGLNNSNSSSRSNDSTREEERERGEREKQNLAAAAADKTS